MGAIKTKDLLIGGAVVVGGFFLWRAMDASGGGGGKTVTIVGGTGDDGRTKNPTNANDVGIAAVGGVVSVAGQITNYLAESDKLAAQQEATKAAKAEADKEKAKANAKSANAELPDPDAA